MAATRSSTSANGLSTGTLRNVKSEHDKEKADQQTAKSVHELVTLIQPDRCVGDLISMDYDTAEVLIHDRLRQDVGGVPHGCLLLATRIKPDDESLDLYDAQTSLILLRALRSSSLPNEIEMMQARLEAGQRATQTLDNWDEGGKTDQFTLDQMRYAGAHCRILGTFRMNNINPEKQVWQLEFGGDIDNFYSGQGMKVFKPAGQALERIVNFPRWEDMNADANTNADSAPVSIGKLRYAASIRNLEGVEAVPVYMTTEDLLAQRTALFGMTRTGKSNTTKTIADAVFQLRISKSRQRVGQLIFDPNGEYANENSQDQGCLKNVAVISPVSEDVVTYGLTTHPNDPDRKITKFNFFGDAIPIGTDTGKQAFDEALQSLYQGKDLVNDALQEETSGYVRSFINADITAPPDVDNSGANTRYRRALFVYKSALYAAGFQPPTRTISIKGLFSKDILAKMKQDDDLSSSVVHIEKDNNIPWDIARNFCRGFSKWVQTKPFEEFDTAYAVKHSENRSWSDDLLLGLLRIFENTRGFAFMGNARQWHDLESTTDYADDIVNHVRSGRLVIFDQALGDPSMNERAAARIMQRIFLAQQQAFVSPETNENNEIEKPPPVIIYVEEAHTLLPKGSEIDTTNIWARVAKEGAKFNIGLVYSTQEPSSIQTNILKNTENWFIAHLNNTDETRQLSKYNDFFDFTDSITKVNETGFLRVRTLSSPYTLPVQINKFVAPTSKEEPEALTTQAATLFDQQLR